MRLISLYIEEYKNIKQQTFDFSANTGYIALIGLNGSGKSNLLEAIGLIFNGLLNNKRIPFAYEIKYEHDGKTYLRKPRIAMIDGSKVKDTDMFYPSSVIACYSGEDLRLWHLVFEDYYMHYFKSAIDGKILTPKLMYINRYCWEIALIALMSSGNPDIKSFLKSNFDIIDTDDVELLFEFAENDENFKDHNALKWIKRIKERCLDSAGNATLKSFLSYDFPLIPNRSKECTLFYYLYLLSQPKNNPLKGNSIDKYITKICIKNKGIRFSNYSEGHKKLILIECITRVLGSKETLLLFDEPDAHVHIDNKKKLFEAITAFEGQSMITTHSPVFVNGIYKQEKNDLFFMEDGTLANSDFINNLIALSGGEIDFLKGSIILTTKNILVTEGPYDKKYLEKAIEVLKSSNSRYEKFDQIAIISSGSAGNSQTFYEQVLMPQIKRYDKIVFVFDYDKAGFEGWKKIQKLNNIKLSSVFYQTDYSKRLCQEPSAIAESIMVEDLFSPKAYKNKIDSVKLDQKTTHKDFRCFNENMASSIKTYIENNYSKFDDEWYDGFRSVLDELLNVFDL